MSEELNIVPLRSLVAVADHGGFLRAAERLHLTQGAVSQHIRRLERAIGHPLVERHGRGSRFTSYGEDLVSRARRILAVHDETLAHFATDRPATITIGSTEHAAAQLLPALSRGLESDLPTMSFKFRVDRGMPLREGLASGRVDIALLLGRGEQADAEPVADLELTWFAAPGWRRPPQHESLPVVAFDDPCALRTRALETLSAARIPAVVGAEAPQLAGVQAAVAAGLGVALMATLGETPDGLVQRDDLPAPAPLPLFVCSRPGTDPEIPRRAESALRRRLRALDNPVPDDSALFPFPVDLPQGA